MLMDGPLFAHCDSFIGLLRARSDGCERRAAGLAGVAALKTGYAILEVASRKM